MQKVVDLVLKISSSDQSKTTFSTFMVFTLFATFFDPVRKVVDLLLKFHLSWELKSGKSTKSALFHKMPNFYQKSMPVAGAV